MSFSKKSSRFIWGLAVAIVLPLSFYIIAKILKKDQIVMPRYFVVDSIDSQVIDGKVKYDTVFHKAGELTGSNQFGDQVKLNADLQGKILVLSFFDVNHPNEVSKQLASNMAMLQRAFKPTPMKANDKVIHFISITSKSANDTSDALFNYAQHYKANMNNWWFITADKKQVHDYAIKELQIVPDIIDADSIMHTTKFVLLDADRNIRGYFNGLDSASVGILAYEIGQLNMEKKHLKAN